MLPASLTSCSGNAQESGFCWGMALWEGEGGETRVNRIFPREDDDMSLGHIKEVRGHQGKRDCY